MYINTHTNVEDISVEDTSMEMCKETGIFSDFTTYPEEPNDRKSSVACRNKSWTRAQNVGPRLAILFTSV